jgi:hypothetical protein
VRSTLLEVHVDMVARAFYARDFKLLRERLWRGTRRDVSLSRVLGNAAWRLVKNRLAL